MIEIDPTVTALIPIVVGIVALLALWLWERRRGRNWRKMDRDSLFEDDFGKEMKKVE